MPLKCHLSWLAWVTHAYELGRRTLALFIEGVSRSRRSLRVRFELGQGWLRFDMESLTEPLPLHRLSSKPRRKNLGIASVGPTSKSAAYLAKGAAKYREREE